MSEDTKTPAAVAAALSMLGLSLGISGPASAQITPGAPTPGTQGVLIGLNQPGSSQIKSEQLKSEQLKSAQIKSDQLKSQQWKSSAYKSQAYKMGQ